MKTTSKLVTKYITYICPQCGKEIPEKTTIIPICYGPTKQDFLDAAKYLCCGDPKCIEDTKKYIEDGTKHENFYVEVPSKVTYYE